MNKLFLVLIFMISVGRGPVSGQNTPETGLFDGRVLKAIHVDISRNGQQAEYWEQTARTLIPMKANDRFQSGELVRTLSILSDSGLFSRIHVDDPEPSGEGIVLTFILTPYERIRSIDIDGAFPYFTNEILRIMSIRPGDVFIQEDLERQKKRIAEFFKKEGFIDPKVEMSFKKDFSDGGYAIRSVIEKGPYFKVDSVEFQGLSQLKPGDFKIKSKRMVSGRLNRKQAREDEKQILKICWKKGFADAAVSLQIETSDNLQTAHILYKIEEGPLYRTSFSGNNEIAKRHLEKMVTWLKEGDRHRFGIKKTVRGILKAYKEKGFIKARVRHSLLETRKSGQWVRTVAFIIEEGPQHLISGLTLKGCERISEDRIRERILSLSGRWITPPVYDPEELEKDLNEIRILYLKEGFQNASVDKSVRAASTEPGKKTDNVDVQIIIHIKEGPQTLIRSVDFSGFPDLDPEAARQMISAKHGDPFRSFMLEKDETILKAHISEKGYPHVSITSDFVIRPDGTQARITFRCDPGPFVSMGQVIYAGNFRTRPEVLDDEISPGTSKPLSLMKLMQIRKKLSDVEVLDAVRIRTPGLKEKASIVHVVAEVYEKKSYSLEVETGYDTRRQLYLRSQAGDHNFFGRNLDLTGGAEISQIGYHLNLGLKDPNINGSGISSVSDIFIEKKEEFNKDFGTRTSGISQEFARFFLDEKLTFSVGGSLRRQEIYAVSPAFFSDDPNTYRKARTILSAGPSATFRTSDSFVRPTTGVLITGDVSISRGLEDDMDSFVKYRFDGRYYVTPMKRITLALRGGYGLIHSYGSRSNIPEDQLFFLGGTSSVRGFDENMLRLDKNGNAAGGKQMAAFNFETRIEISDKIELALFTDAGSINDVPGASGSWDFRTSVGTGIRYHTPIGPISLLYGHKLDPRTGEDAGAFHLSMGYTF